MALPREYVGFEDALNIVAEIVSTCTKVPGPGSLTIWGIKEVLNDFPIQNYKLKRVLTKKNVKSLGIPDDKYEFVLEQTHDALSSIDSVDYNSAVFMKEVFTKNYYFPTLIGSELVEKLHIDEDADLLKAVRFVIAVYLIHWTEEPDFPLETRQELLLLKTDVIKNSKDIVDIYQTIESLKARIEYLEKASRESNPIELTIIPISITALIGRESIIQDITSKFETNNILCINADGGLGKTAIAKKVINNIRSEIGKENSKYKFVAWLTSSGNLKEDLSKINIPNNSSDNQEDRHKKACRFLQTHPTFLVIDNMDEIPTTEDINILNTIAGTSTILITSRAYIDAFPSYGLPSIGRDAAVVLFYNHYFPKEKITCITHEKILAETNSGRIEDVYKIVDATDRNALIIELIAKTARADSLSISDLWKKISLGIFGFESRTEVQTDHAGKYPKSRLSIDEQMRELYSMLKLSDRQKEIMSFISLFPAEHDIFSNVFKWAGFFDQGANDIMYLVERGWIIHEDDYYSIHTIVRDSINLQNQKKGNIISILNYERLIEKLSDIDSYIPRTAEFNLTQKLSFVPQTVGRLLSENHPYSNTIGIFFNNLAGLYKDQGNYDEALKYYKLDLEISEKTLGKCHPDTAITYNGIANIYRIQGKYDEALRYYKMDLEISEKTLGKDHPGTAATYHGIATTYKNQGKYDEALKYYKLDLEISEKALGKGHPDTAATYNGIANIYRILGNYNEALKYYKLDLEISEKTLGKGHPDTAAAYNGIANIYRILGNYDEALKYYKLDLEISEKTLGKGHPDTAATYNGIAATYKNQGKYDEALKYYKLALKISEKTLGKDHPENAATYHGIATTYKNQGKYDEALKYYKLDLEIREKTLGKGHPDTAATYNGIANIYRILGNYDEALKYYKMDLEISERTFGKEHPETATTYNNIAGIYVDQGNYDVALKFYNMALTCYEKKLGIHPYTAVVHENLAVLYHDMRNQEESQKHADMAKEIRKELGDK